LGVHGVGHVFVASIKLKHDAQETNPNPCNKQQVHCAVKGICGVLWEYQQHPAGMPTVQHGIAEFSSQVSAALL
jgi:hypothetical protein